MNHQRVLYALERLGLTQTDAQVYIYLTIKGPQKEKDIAEALKIHEHLLSQSLKNLQNTGVVSSKLEYSPIFFASSFDKALELLLQAYLNETRNIEQNKEEILSRWKSIINSGSLG